MKAKHYFKHFHCFHVPWIINNEVWISVDISSFRVFLMFVISRFFFHPSDRLSCAVNAVVSHFIVRTWSAFFFFSDQHRGERLPIHHCSSPLPTRLSSLIQTSAASGIIQTWWIWRENCSITKRLVYPVREWEKEKKEKTWQTDMVRSSGVPKFLSGTHS